MYRLDASKTSFTGIESDVLAFLRTNGWDPEKVEESPPWILVDTSSWRYESQVRQHLMLTLPSYRL